MKQERVETKVLEQLRKAFDDAGVNYIIGEQDNVYVRQTALKKNSSRTYCYVLFNDKTGIHKGKFVFNLAFRLKRGTIIKRILNDNNGASSYLTEFAERFIKVWSKETNTPARLREPGHSTEQYGILVSKEDLEHPAFSTALANLINQSVLDSR